MSAAEQAVWTFVVLASLLSPLVALVVAVGLYSRYVAAQASGTLGRYVGGVLGSGIGAGFFGAAFGVPGFCAIWPAGHCSLGGLLIVAPLAFSAGVGLFLYLSLRGKRIADE